MMVDPHMQLCISEHIIDDPLPCQFCSKESDAFASDGGGWVCEPCVVKNSEWTEVK